MFKTYIKKALSLTSDGDPALPRSALKIATDLLFGLVKPDNKTIVIKDGVISAVGGTATTTVVENPYELPTATRNRKGGFIPDDITIKVNPNTAVASVIFPQATDKDTFPTALELEEKDLVLTLNNGIKLRRSLASLAGSATGVADGNTYPTILYVEDGIVFNMDLNNGTTLSVDLKEGVREIAGAGYFNVELQGQAKRLVFYGTDRTTIVDISELFSTGTGGANPYPDKFSLRLNTTILDIQLSNNQLLSTNINPVLAYKVLAKSSIVTNNNAVNTITSSGTFNTILAGSSNKIIGDSSTSSISNGNNNTIESSNLTNISNSISCEIIKAPASNIHNSLACKIEYTEGDQFTAGYNNIENSNACKAGGQRNKIIACSATVISGNCIDVTTIGCTNFTVTGGGAYAVYINCRGTLAGVYGKTYINNIVQPST